MTSRKWGFSKKYAINQRRSQVKDLASSFMINALNQCNISQIILQSLLIIIIVFELSTS